MPTGLNKYRAAVEVLQHGRDQMVESLADEILDQSDDLTDSGYAFNELLETQGTRLHFLSLLVAHLEQSAEFLEDAQIPPSPPLPKTTPKKRRKPRAKKIQGQAAPEENADNK
ncbi:MAG: hypothetical protein ABI353_12920 [Isosphaeraceae bacterium]